MSSNNSTEHQNQNNIPRDHPRIDYPCSWVYKVIGEDCSLLKELIVSSCEPYQVSISHSQASSKGKYHSLDAQLVVPSEEVRLAIYDKLKANPAVKIVL
jgi:putative lipoic acid-binding regulatory protein